MLEKIPTDLSILPLRNIVVFPFIIVPLAIGITRSVRLVEDALKGDHLIGLIASKDGTIDEPVPSQMYEVGTVAKVRHAISSREEHRHIVVEGIERFQVQHWLNSKPYLRARTELVPDIIEPGFELDALVHNLRDLTKKTIKLIPYFPEEVGGLLDQLEDPQHLFYMVAANARLKMKTSQQILEMDHLKDKYRALVSHLTTEKEILTRGRKIHTGAKNKMSKV
jgi:ATP-dependent Lon protease